MVGAALLDDALRAAGVADPRVASVQAFELMGRPPAGGLVIGVSHEGGTWATNEALRQAAEAGAQTALITVSDRSPGAAVAGRVVQTGEQDQSWCHTVGYLSPMLTFAVLAGMLRRRSAGPGGGAGAARQRRPRRQRPNRWRRPWPDAAACWWSAAASTTRRRASWR